MKYKYIGSSQYYDGEQTITHGDIVSEMLRPSSDYEKIEARSGKKIIKEDKE